MYVYRMMYIVIRGSLFYIYYGNITISYASPYLFVTVV